MYVQIGKKKKKKTLNSEQFSIVSRVSEIHEWAIAYFIISCYCEESSNRLPHSGMISISLTCKVTWMLLFWVGYKKKLRQHCLTMHSRETFSINWSVIPAIANISNEHILILQHSRDWDFLNHRHMEDLCAQKVLFVNLCLWFSRKNKNLQYTSQYIVNHFILLY